LQHLSDALLQLIIGISEEEIAAWEVVNVLPMTVNFDDSQGSKGFIRK